MQVAESRLRTAPSISCDRGRPPFSFLSIATLKSPPCPSISLFAQPGKGRFLYSRFFCFFFFAVCVCVCVVHLSRAKRRSWHCIGSEGATGPPRGRAFYRLPCLSVSPWNFSITNISFIFFPFFSLFPFHFLFLIFRCVCVLVTNYQLYNFF